MNKALLEDLDGLTSYTFEHEFEDFVDSIVESDVYCDIVDEKDVNRLSELRMNGNLESDEALDIIYKIAENLECRHVYAIAHRLWKYFVKDSGVEI